MRLGVVESCVLREWVKLAVYLWINQPKWIRQLKIWANERILVQVRAWQLGELGLKVQTLMPEFWIS